MDLALGQLQWLICYKIKPKQSKRDRTKSDPRRQISIGIPFDPR